MFPPAGTYTLTSSVCLPRIFSSSRTTFLTFRSCSRLACPEDDDEETLPLLNRDAPIPKLKTVFLAYFLFFSLIFSTIGHFSHVGLFVCEAYFMRLRI